MAENGNESSIGDDGFEDGMPWLLPTNVLDEDGEVAEAVNHPKAALDRYLRFQKHHHHHHQPPPPAAAEPLLHSWWQRSSQMRPQRTRNGTNAKWGAIGGPGMQAVFLDSGKRSCGTGVFLPRRAGTQQFQSSNNKPAYSTVLLPSRVIQTLNLNVHQLGFPKPHQDCNNKNSKGGGGNCNLLNPKRNNITTTATDASTGDEGEYWCPPEIFLPKEWTY